MSRDISATLAGEIAMAGHRGLASDMLIVMSLFTAAWAFVPIGDREQALANALLGLNLGREQADAETLKGLEDGI